MTDEEIEKLHRIAMDNSELALISLRYGDLDKYRRLSADALLYEKKAALEFYEKQIEPTRSVLFRSAGYIALDNADFIEAQKLYEYAMEGNPPGEMESELEGLKIEIDRIRTENENFLQVALTFSFNKPNPSKEEIEKNILRSLKSFNEREINVDFARDYLFRQFNIESENHITLEESDFKSWIYDRKGAVDKQYWERYKTFLLKDEEWAPDTINKLDNITDDILDHLNDPKAIGSWDKRGMVVGQVQSGKTSNYIGLMCKAADYGYKAIVVLAGMTKDLRSQTQLRTDMGFLGWDTKIERAGTFAEGRNFGVSKYDHRPQAHYLTTSELEGDFNTYLRRLAGTNIKTGGQVVMVVKKNVTVLKELIRWFADQGIVQPDGKRLVKDLPLLVIDDEADNASINISKDSISSINGLVRSLLSLFQKSGYVGYTATPFANVFIPLSDVDDSLAQGLDVSSAEFWRNSGRDLFPKDFIINIPPPSNYIGPREIFGIEPQYSVDDVQFEKGLSIIEELRSDEYGKYFPDNPKLSDEPPTQLPESLKKAVKLFILNCAIRRARGQIRNHNSMLVHVTRFVFWQNKIASQLDKLLKTYQQQIHYRQGSIVEELKALYENEVLPVTDEVLSNNKFDDSQIKRHDWFEIESQLNKAAGKIQVRAIHGDNRLDGLEFENISSLDYYDHKKTGLSIIAVGGNKLSRGLTLEGLSVSYYLRSSKMYDTLMQMGRWFGYRSGYLDLCRIFTSGELIKWYKYITVASEELRAEFEDMKMQRKSPKNFGIKVRQHPDVLKITATNKMREAQEMELTFSDKLRETWAFKRDKRELSENFIHTYKYIQALGSPSMKNDQPYVWYRQNNFEDVIQFLRGFKAEDRLEHQKIIEYIMAQTKENFLVNWTVVLVATSKESSYKFIIGEKETRVGLTMRSDSKKGVGETYEISRSHIIDPLHESLDFDKKGEDYEEALKLTIEDWKASTRKKKRPEQPEKPSGKNIRAKRKVTDGLLLIYPLDPKPDDWLNSDIEEPIIGYAISFPKNDHDKKIKYSVNQVFLREYDYEDVLDEQLQE
jgi:hypothetical protein